MLKDVSSSRRHATSGSEDEDSIHGSEDDTDDHAAGEQATLNDIARCVTRIEANLLELFEHIGLTLRRPPSP
ncbi:UNVERIFIED_CONTAM: hypothetical protein Slati_4508400 [Sesamum latifolium]|uniref:Uncharacterized protein n=1 Tax=Sesamum latifolium TaxID=2727402 RepID=A0AAW2STF9_9LAMI